MRLPKLLVISGILLVAVAGSGVVLVQGWRWYQGLVLPRSVKPHLESRNWSPPAGAVPREPAEPPLPRNEAAESLRNPQPATPESIARGKKSFDTYCALCHGKEGHGDGPVVKKFPLGPPDLPSNLRRRTDGFLYGTIRNGGFIMPPHGYRIPPEERWHLVNYLRSIQE